MFFIPSFIFLVKVHVAKVTEERKKAEYSGYVPNIRFIADYLVFYQIFGKYQISITIAEYIGTNI